MNKFKKALCLILSLVLTITLIPANSAQAASSTKSLDFTIKIRNSHQQLSWDSLNTSILSTNFQDFSGAVTVTYNFEQNEDKPGCTPEIYLRTGWNESDKLESPHTITDKGQKSLTVKYPAAKIKKILNSGYVYVYGCNIKIKSILNLSLIAALQKFYICCRCSFIKHYISTCCSSTCCSCFLFIFFIFTFT